MTYLRLFLFGPPRITYRDQVIESDRRKALALLAYLAMTEQPQSRDVLAAMLWPNSDQGHARSALRAILPSLTALMPDNIIIADRMTVSLKRDKVWTDVGEFLSLLAQRRSHAHPAESVCEQCVELLSQAAALYQGDFLAGFTLPDSSQYDEWQLLQREWLCREYSSVLRRLAYYYCGQGMFEESLLYGKRWLNLDSLHEPAHRLLMQLYAASGQRAEALRQYEECKRLLNTELSVAPEDATIELYEAIKENKAIFSQNSPSTRLKPGILPPLPNLLIGRETVLGDLKARFGLAGKADTRPVTVIQGWPGVGKSTSAAALAHDAEVETAFPDGILWASLGISPSILTGLSTWADALNILEVGRSRKIGDISAHLAATLRNKRMLLIVDDIWQAEDAQPFKVGGHDCAMLMITRFNDVAQSLAPTPADIYKMPVLLQDKAFELLQILAPEAVQQHPREAGELVKDLDGLPLALQVAGRLLHSEGQLGWGVDNLLRELRQGTALLSSHAPADMSSFGSEAYPTIDVLLRRSIDLLDSQTRERFIALGFFAPKPATFDLDALATAWDIDDPRPTARILVNRGLLEPVGAGRFQIHALLIMHARSLMD